MNIELPKEELKKFLLQSNDKDFNEMIEFIHPVDLLDILHESEEEASIILNRLPKEVIASLLDEEEDDDIYDFLLQFSEAKQQEILKEMSSDEIVDFMQSLDQDESNYVFSQLDHDAAKEVSELIEYAPDTAGGIMATEFISIRENKTVLETLQYLQKEAQDAEMAYYLYVVDKKNHLKGVLSLRDLISTPFDQRISEITNPNVQKVHIQDDQEAVADLLAKYDYVMMPVVDDNDIIKGVITIDDVVDIIKEEATEDIYRMAGIHEEEELDGSLVNSLKSRLPWLGINLFTATCAAMVVASFSSTIEAVVALAAINPVIAGMGGNAGTQSLTIVVRGIALGELTGENARRIFFKEVKVGLSSGILLGSLLALGCYLVFNNPFLGLVAGIAMIFNLLIATTAGFIVPLVLKKMNIDPALASSVFVTTATDVLGFFIFLSLATIFLEKLL